MDISNIDYLGLDRYAGRDCNLLLVTDRVLGEAAYEKYGFSEKLECYQVAYYGEKPSPDAGLAVRAADLSDLLVLTEHYRLISPEEMESLVRRGSVLLGYFENELVGFIGEHLEGSMGLLYVLPEYRRRGFGSELEKHLIARTMEEGYTPFGQVVRDNRDSLELQKKIGMTQSENIIVWMWRE